MTEEVNQPASAESEPVAQPLEQPKQTEAATPASDKPEEEWDQKRAMDTIHKLREIEKQSKKDSAELARLKDEEQKRADASMTESERLKKERDELVAKAAKLETDLLRRDVIAESGLPPAFVDRLKGNTKDELLADAQELLKLLPKQKNTQSVTNPGEASPNETLEQKRARLFGEERQDIFNFDNIRAGGGGVTSFKE